MTKFIFTLALIVSSFFSIAQNKINSAAGADKTNLSDGTQLLFKNTKSKLSIEEKNKLFENLNLELSKDKKEFVADGFSLEAHIYPTDMNKDGTEEIFVVLASAALYGNVGKTFFLYMKNSLGEYRQQPKIGGGIPTILSTKNLEYNDILIGLPGMEFPVWRWNGKNYIFYKNIKNEAMEKMASTQIEDFSKSYTSTIKD